MEDTLALVSGFDPSIERPLLAGTNRPNILNSTRSLWESIEALRAFVYSVIHRRYLNRTREWFVESDEINMVLWSAMRGETPELADARKRLEHLRSDGPSEQAFDFASAAAFVRDGL